MAYRRFWWVPLALAALVALALFGLRPIAQAPRTVGAHVGQIAPNFTLKTLDGRTITLRDLRGHPVWLNFFASWCPPCKREAPSMVALKRANPSLEIIGMNLTGSELSLADVKAFQAKFGINYPIALDRGNRVSTEYLVQVLPTSVFIDASGVIRKITVDELLPGMMKEALSEIGFHAR